VIGRHVSHFYLIRRLGTGGMGVVYEAQDTRLPRSVAIKLLKPGLSRDAEAVRRFTREARIASSLNHPNICTVLDVDEFDGQTFIAMELLRGRSLKDRLGGDAMRLEEIVDVGVQVASALAVAHDRGIMHRDITPNNIFLTDAGLAKLLDFGLAKHFARGEDDTAASDDLTGAGGLPGTAPYMAPELLTPSAAPDHRCDLYSLGAVLYEMATGTKPFEARSRHDLAAALRAPHIPLRRLAPHHPKLLEAMTDRLLAKDPGDRYPSGAAVRADLDGLRQMAGASAPAIARPDAHPLGIAVLPFRAITPDPALSDVGEGLAEDLSGRLSQVRELRVAPRTLALRMGDVPPAEAGARLNVDMVVSGTLECSEDGVRVVASLLDARDRQSSEARFDVHHGMEEPFAVQDEVVRRLLDKVTAGLARQPERGSTRDPDALQSYKRGRHCWRNRFVGGWRDAIEHFQSAIDRDPHFALAHVALAASYEFLGSYCMMRPKLAYSIARRSTETALALNDELAVAHRQLALIELGGEWDWEASEAAFRRALALDPSDPVTHICYAWLLMLLGRDAAAHDEARTGHELAPASRFAAAGRAFTSYLARRYDEAIEWCSASLQLEPDDVFAPLIRGQCFELQGRMPEAIDDLELAARLAGRAPYFLGVLGHCYGMAGRRQQALDVLAELDRLTRETYVAPQCYVFVHAGLGERERALTFQDRAYEDGAPPFNYLAPYIRDFYALDPRNKHRLQQMRLVV
jgi:tetratricopeptide (TPR) repeat protein/TolB-like protein/predicted Ser/Thr protein kinase